MHTTLVENVRIDCYIMDKEKICLILMDNITNVLLHTKVIHKLTSGLDEYVIDDLRSGTTDSGLRCLSIAVCEDTEDEIPFSKELAYYVKSGNTVELYSENGWSNGELHSYNEYSESKQDFRLFRPASY